MSTLLFVLPALLAAPPDPPTLVAPADGKQDVAPSPTLVVSVSDPDGDPLSVTVEARPRWIPGEDFTVVALPDTQYYACGCNGGLPETFVAQTAWVVEALAERDIAFVTLLGDCVENGDTYPEEWVVADEAFSLLEDTETTGLEEGVPYGIAVGNHDQSPFGDPDGSTALYNATFGVDRFAERSWYGGHRGENNDDHYQLFEAGHTGYLVLHLEYDPVPAAETLAWAQGVLDDHADRLAIVVSHYLIGTTGSWGTQGEATWEALRDRPNLLLMLSGHVPGVGQRSDTWGGRTVHTLLADYQMEANGGDGWLRVLTFSPGQGTITVETWSPTRQEFDTSADNAFVLEADLGPPFVAIGDPETVASGETVSVVHEEATVGQAWEWRAIADDGGSVAVSQTWTFAVGEPDSGAEDSAGPDSAGTDTADSDADLVPSAACGCASAVPGGGLPWLVLGLLGWRRGSRTTASPRS